MKFSLVGPLFFPPGLIFKNSCLLWYNGNSGGLFFLGSLQMVTATIQLKTLAPWKKAMTNLDSMLKSRDITLPTKFHLVKAIVFAVVMYGCESWTIKKAECWRINAFELRCWKRLSRFSLRITARRSNWSILKEISPEYLLEAAVHGVARVRFDWATELNWTDAKAEIQYFEHLIWRIDSLKKAWYWERLKAEEGDDRGWDCWMAPLTLWTRVWASSGCWWWTGKPGMLQSMASQRVKQDWATTLNWTDYNTQLFL